MISVKVITSYKLYDTEIVSDTQTHETSRIEDIIGSTIRDVERNPERLIKTGKNVYKMGKIVKLEFIIVKENT